MLLPISFPLIFFLLIFHTDSKSTDSSGEDDSDDDDDEKNGNGQVMTDTCTYVLQCTVTYCEAVKVPHFCVINIRGLAQECCDRVYYNNAAGEACAPEGGAVMSSLSQIGPLPRNSREQEE